MGNTVRLKYIYIETQTCKELLISHGSKVLYIIVWCYFLWLEKFPPEGRKQMTVALSWLSAEYKVGRNISAIVYGGWNFTQIVIFPNQAEDTITSYLTPHRPPSSKVCETHKTSKAAAAATSSLYPTQQTPSSLVGIGSGITSTITSTVSLCRIPAPCI